VQETTVFQKELKLLEELKALGGLEKLELEAL
jgi:hypothetical protein